MSEWSETPLSEIARPISRAIDVIPGQSYRTIGVRWWGEGAYERETIDGARTAAKSLSVVRHGDLIINKIWVRHGSTAIAGSDVDGCAASGEFPTFELNTDRVVREWLHWQTKTRGFWAKCDALSQGTSGKNRIKPELFLTVPIPLPPMSEQRRVVARIEELSAQIHEARTLRRQATQEAGALLKSGLHRLANRNWGLARLDAVLLSKPRNGWSAKCDSDENGTAVLALSAVTGFKYCSTAFKRTSLTTASDAEYWLKPGDLLITRSNTPELVGHAAIYDGSPSPCIYPDLMMRLEVAPDLTDSRFVWYWLQSPVVREFIVRNAKGSSPTMKKISQPLVMSIPFPSGVPLAEQRRIVAELDALQAEVDALKRLQAETSAELDALLPAILDRAFKGEL